MIIDLFNADDVHYANVGGKGYNRLSRLYLGCLLLLELYNRSLCRAI